MNLLLLLLVILLLVGAFPVWPYAQHWGYFPAGGLGVLLIIILVLILLGRL